MKGMVRYLGCPKNEGAADVYDGEKILFCENNKMEYYKT